MTRRLAAPWTLATAALAVVVTAAWLGGSSVADALLADAHEVARGQWWRLLTGPFVHATVSHLLWDVSILVATGLAYERRFGVVWPLLLAVGLAAPTAVVFLWDPRLDVYYGLSGLTHTLMAAAVVSELVSGNRRWYVLGAALALAVKVTRGMVGPSLVGPSLPAGIHEVPIVHVVGALAGTVIAWALVDSGRAQEADRAAVDRRHHREDL